MSQTVHTKQCITNRGIKWVTIHMARLHMTGSDWGMHIWTQCFMQDKIIASRTSFVGHMNVNC